MRHPVQATVLAVLAACSDTTAPRQPPPSFGISPQAQWSGGAVTIRSASFAGQVVLPAIMALPADTLALVRVDDSTVTTTVPLGPSGPLTFYTVRRGDTLQVGGVVRFGYREVRTLPQPLSGELTVQSVGGDPVVFGTVLPGYGIGWVDLETGQSALIDSVTSPGLANYGMSPTELPGVFVVADLRQANQLERWQLLPSPQLLDTVPYQLPGRHLSRLAPHIWLETTHHYTTTRADTSASVGGFVFDAQIESVWDVYVSPRGDRATVSVNAVSGLPGVPVYNTASGDTAFTIPLWWVDAATFSTTGDRIFAAGAYFGRKILAIDATSGAVLAQAILPDSLGGYALAHDPVRNQLLVTLGSGSSMAVYVFDASTLTIAGVLPAPLACPATSFANCGQAVMAVDAMRREAHFVASAGLAKTYVFDLLP